MWAKNSTLTFYLMEWMSEISRSVEIFEKFKLNRNLRRIPFKMMYNMTALRHRFSNEWVGVAPWATFLSYSVKVCILFNTHTMKIYVLLLIR